MVSVVDLMFEDVANGSERRADSPCNSSATREAVGVSYRVDPLRNLFLFRPLNMAWLKANVLHFFACTERAEPLLRVNSHASRYLTGWRFVGAYGPIFLPQLRLCVDELRRDLSSRRAIAAAGLGSYQDVNQPPCWSSLQLLFSEGALSLHVHQRSCQLHGVMPYDCVALTSVLLWAAWKLNVPASYMRWTFGSLHCTAEELAKPRSAEVGAVHLDPALLDSPAACWAELEKL